MFISLEPLDYFISVVISAADVGVVLESAVESAVSVVGSVAEI